MNTAHHIFFHASNIDKSTYFSLTVEISCGKNTLKLQKQSSTTYFNNKFWIENALKQYFERVVQIDCSQKLITFCCKIKLLLRSFMLLKELICIKLLIAQYPIRCPKIDNYVCLLKKLSFDWVI